MERKVIPFCEIKLAPPDPEAPAGVKLMKFSGYGAAFNNVDSYGDVIEPGAFGQTLADAQKTGIFPSMLSQHGALGLTSEDMTPVGVWESLAEDGKGLLSDGILAPTQRGSELYTLMGMKPRPAINGLSIGYRVKRATMRTKPEEPRRRIHEISLIEISPVTFPANSDARVHAVKSAGGALSEREFERLMQDAGLSRKEARIVMDSGYRSLLAMQDAGSTELEDLAATIRKAAALY